MFKVVYQIMDDKGQPQGGRVFVAPDQATLDASVASCILPFGWTRHQVSDETAIVNPPPTTFVPLI